MANLVQASNLLVSSVTFVTGLTIGIITTKRFPNIFPFIRIPAQDADDSDGEDDDDDDEEEDDDDDETSDDSSQPQKMVFCVRTDLKMQKGKIAAQVAHATLGAYKQAVRRQKSRLRLWEGQAQPKIALQISSRQQINALQAQATRLGLITEVVKDAGRTQIEPGSLTVLAIGPGPTNLINQVTGSLKLL